MRADETNIKGAFIITNNIFEDKRGFFMESFNEKVFANNNGSFDFVQDNHSKSSKGVLRGLHYQIEHPQGKLVRCTQGSIYDVIVDIREQSPTFGRTFATVLDRPEVQLWAPPGLAHGFYTLSDTAEFEYKVTDYYYPEYDRTLLWNSSGMNIAWPTKDPILSDKDKVGKSFDECEKYAIIN